MSAAARSALRIASRIVDLPASLSPTKRLRSSFKSNLNVSKILKFLMTIPLIINLSFLLLQFSVKGAVQHGLKEGVQAGAAGGLAGFKVTACAQIEFVAV